MQLTYPDGRVLQNAYDPINRLSSVTYQKWGAQRIGMTYWTATSYASPGQVQTAQFGNGMQLQAVFNNRQSMTFLSYQSTGSSTQTYFSKTYQWDKNALNLIGETDQVSSKQRQYGYDKLNRLVSAADVTVSATYATGTATISGFEGFQRVCPGGPDPDAEQTQPQRGAQPQQTIGGPCHNEYDTGTISITVGGFTVSAPYARFSNSTNLASALAGMLNGSGSPVTATASGTTITMTATTAGSIGDYSLSYSTDGDFDATFSGSTMAGGQSAQPVPGGFNQQYALDPWGNLSSMGSSGFNQSINLQNQVSSFNYDAA